MEEGREEIRGLLTRSLLSVLKLHNTQSKAKNDNAIITDLPIVTVVGSSGLRRQSLLRFWIALSDVPRGGSFLFFPMNTKITFYFSFD